MPDDHTELADLVKRAEAIIGIDEQLALPRIADPLELWKGEFGEAYIERCRPTAAEIAARSDLWREILYKLPTRPRRILEVGANVGANIEALRTLLPDAKFLAVEPNAKARSRIVGATAKEGSGQSIPFDANEAGLVFTMGVLIHINPDDLLKVCQEIYRVSARYIVCAEYFSPVPREVVYRGMSGGLWTRDFGSFWLDNFPDLRCLGYGFSWKRMTGLDDVTWFVFEKP